MRQEYAEHVDACNRHDLDAIRSFVDPSVRISGSCDRSPKHSALPLVETRTFGSRVLYERGLTPPTSHTSDSNAAGR
jgi:hypothetical protein